MYRPLIIFSIVFFFFKPNLEAMEKKGVQLTKKYTMDSPLAEMKGEYETIKKTY